MRVQNATYVWGQLDTLLDSYCVNTNHRWKSFVFNMFSSF